MEAKIAHTFQTTQDKSLQQYNIIWIMNITTLIIEFAGPHVRKKYQIILLYIKY